MKTFFNDTRPGEKPKYFTLTLNGYNYVYSNMDDVNNWKEIEKQAGNICRSGVISYKMKENIKIIELDIKEAERKPNKSY
jgi:hypothetical protein